MPGYIKPPSNQYIYSSSTVDGARIMTAASDYGFRNKLINGDFSIWQRGTSFNISSNSNTFCADRWQIQSQGGTAVASQQNLTPGILSGIETPYYLRLVQSAGTANTLIINRLEDARTLAGQTITVSYWAKASASTTITARFDQDFGSGGSSRTAFGGMSNAINTSWARYSSTMTIGSISGKTIGSSSYIEFFLYYPNTAGITVELAGVQIESGLFATSFEQRPQQVELAMCQRYYVRLGGGATYDFIGVGNTVSTSGGYVITQFPVKMRSTPSSIDYTNLGVAQWGSSPIVVTSAFILNNGSNASSQSAVIQFAGTGFVAGGTFVNMTGNGSSGYIGFNAEL
jgi:hypothetical protein